MEFLAANELAILRWIHILAMVYWLGGEWGVFQTSYHVTNHKLPLDERKRHMETAYRIDILARTGIVLLLPLGLHMGKLFGFVPMLEGASIWLMWLFFAVWLGMTWTAFIKRETDIGITGGGNGKHMVYLSGVTDHHVENDDMVSHIVKLVEAKAAEIDAGTSVSMDTLHGKAA